MLYESLEFEKLVSLALASLNDRFYVLLVEGQKEREKNLMAILLGKGQKN